MSKILLYTRQPITDAGFRFALENGKHVVLPPCSSIGEITARVEADRPDIVVLDLTSEVTLAVLREICPRVPVVLWIETIGPELAFQTIQCGVRGVIPKDMPTLLQLAALERVFAGELFFEKSLADTFLCARRVALTRRESEIVALVAQGRKNKEIGALLNITEGTVKVYLSRMYQKLGCKDRYELALWGCLNLGNSPRDFSKGTRTLLIPPRAVPLPGHREAVPFIW